MRTRTKVRIFILAGGRSSRMRTDKSRLLLGSRSFLQRIIATARELDCPVEVVTKDEVPGLGPLGGIATALKGSGFERALFLSCDMPLLTAKTLRGILASDPGGPVFSRVGDQVGFPFVVPRSARSIVLRMIQEERYSVQELRERLRATFFTPDREDEWQFTNANTPADYQRLIEIWRQHHASDAVLELRCLVVRRGNTPMVRELSWQVRQGEHWVVLGANGCGKTTLFSALLGYVTPTRGDIFVLGEEYGDSDWPELRKKIGMVSSSVRQMIPDTEPAWITVASGKYAMIDYWGTPARRDRTEALELLRRSECEYIAERPWGVLSQGERQRVLIARALIANPALLILDEPCAGLDPVARERFLQFLNRFGSSPGAPVMVLVTHHVEEVMPVFTHALLMKEGQKIAEGPVNSTLVSARLSEAFDAAITVRKHAGRYALAVDACGGEMIA